MKSQPIQKKDEDNKVNCHKFIKQTGAVHLKKHQEQDITGPPM